ncbi:MAG: chemotaxis protein CheR [Candidatus Rokubacteria bacterium]|nr:chemotaxis protein CheR [Candidatus Rokubacteria bacterium]
MKDRDGVGFLQWSLPRLELRWPGFRKVRRQVYKRIERRLTELGIPDVSAYRSYLEGHPDEWPVLDALCRIFISRFYRDTAVFQCLEREVLPEMARTALAAGHRELSAWSIGCAGGEEPYTLAILWHVRWAPRFPTLRLRVVATDVDPEALGRAERGCYPLSSVKDLPADLRAGTFAPSEGAMCVKPEYRSRIVFLRQDVRVAAPEEAFHLILCRNVAFTYFDDELQRRTLRRIEDRLLPGGALVIGSAESRPAGATGVEPWSAKLRVYRRSERARPGLAR